MVCHWGGEVGSQIQAGASILGVYGALPCLALHLPLTPRFSPSVCPPSESHLTDPLDGGPIRITFYSSQSIQ